MKTSTMTKIEALMKEEGLTNVDMVRFMILISDSYDHMVINGFSDAITQGVYNDEVEYNSYHELTDKSRAYLHEAFEEVIFEMT